MMDGMNPLAHLLHFDGMLHWCVLLMVFASIVGVSWVMLRVILPLRRLAQQAASIMEGQLPTFETPSGGVHEVEQLRTSLQYMIAQIKTAQEREVAYRNALTESQENERMRIAREIHDETIQSLVLVSHGIERAAQAVEEQDDHTMTHLKHARRQLMQAIDGLRQMIANLRPTVLDELGLVFAIEMLCEANPAVEFVVIGEAYELDHAQELAIFRAAQEAIRNAEHHAQANRVIVTLSYAAPDVKLEVYDDGRGFCIPRHLQELAAKGHYGLIGLHERILHLGGQLDLNSDLTLGTRITVTLPAYQKCLLIA